MLSIQNLSHVYPGGEFGWFELTVSALARRGDMG